MKMPAKHFFIKSAFSLGLVLPLAALCQSDENVPTINFQTVPIPTAIQNLAQMANINFIIDPKLFVAADGTMKPEPSLTLHWQNYTAANALARLVAENHLLMVTNAFTTVVLITETNHVRNPVDTKLFDSDTNEPIPLIYFGDAPLDQVLTKLIKQTSFKVVLDPKLSDEAMMKPPDFKMMPQVSVRWKNLTARQAMVQLCEVYELIIVKGSSPDTVLIKPAK